jgi:glycosyltransferase involved in cell wall biosynthesis
LQINLCIPTLKPDLRKAFEMRILAVNSSPDRSEMHLLKALRRAGLDVRVAGGVPSDRRLELSAASIPVTDIPIRFSIDIPAVLNLRRVVRSQGIDIVHAFSKKGLCNALLATSGTPARLVAYRGYIGHLYRYGLQTRLTYRHPRVRRVICVSDAVRRFLTGVGVPPDRLVTIYKGHDPAWYATKFPGRLSDFGIPAGAFLVGMAGKLRPRKGVDDLVRAAALLPPGRAHYLLVGELTDPAVMPLVRQHGLGDVMHFPGFRTDAAALMGACDVFVMCSPERDALPRAVIEAMSQGVPAIVTNVGGMPEVVVDNQCGLVVPTRDPAALAAAILALAENDVQRRFLGAAARERIRTQFNIERTVTQTLDVYREVLQ